VTLKPEDIKTLDDWQTVHGSRFRLYKDEKERGLSREEALEERVDRFRSLGGASDKSSGKPTRASTPKAATKKASKSRKGDILVRIRPEQGVDPDYFEHLAGSQVEVVLNERWYAWVDTKLNVPYDADVQRLVRHMLILGLGEVITKFQYPRDFEDKVYKFVDE